MRDSPYVNSETYLAVILEEGRDVWEISLPEYHPQHLPLCPPFIVYNKCKIARYKVKVWEGGEKNPEPPLEPRHHRRELCVEDENEEFGCGSERSREKSDSPIPCSRSLIQHND